MVLGQEANGDTLRGPIGLLCNNCMLNVLIRIASMRLF